MPKKEVPVDHLQQFLPPGTGAAVIDYLHQYKVHLTIAAERTSILGDYRHRTHHANHRISVNGNLNTYSFLITLLHEIAHLLTFEQYGNKVQAHGKEWKMIFGQLLQQFVRHKIFPADIEKELLQSLKNPAASSCAEEGLLRVLRNYDAKKSNHHLVEEIAPGTLFRIKDGRVFRKGEQLRKRFKCIEIKTGKMYLFSPVYEIELLPAG
ncbi:MAG: SprT-like domain-containing protein [Chitinophagaceae bacterium]|nr:SprT-like domain-containing protein [Chitinophagaceae bacterium]MBL0305293.1 SprT-like domain-containing protein [Chitinophagaceae bacterium]